MNIGWRSSSLFLTLHRGTEKEIHRLSASKQYTFTFLQPPDTLTPLPHPHHELYIICANGKWVRFSLETLGQVLQQAQSPWQDCYCSVATPQWQNVEPYLKEGIKGKKKGENKKGVQWDICQKIIETGVKIKDDWRISSSANHYAEEQEAQQRNMRQKKTNTEGIWKKPHVALL